jgi:putative NADH-flavin reductase
MKVAIVGASGFVGSALMREALERGHQVKAISRDPNKISIGNANLTKIKADMLKPDEAVEALKGSDLVISAYNPGWANSNIYNEFLEGSQAIQSAVKEAGVKRYIVIGGAGSLEVAPGIQAVDGPDFPAEIKPGATAARDYLNIIRQESELDWTFFSPAFEMHPGTSGVKRGTYRTGLDSPVFDNNGRSVLSVEDLAVVIVDEAENPKHIKERFTAAY